MGNIKQGILGGFNGKVGTVIGYFIHGKSFMRGLAGNVQDANTELQRAVRARFKALVKLGSAFNQAVQVGLKRMAADKRHSTGNSFFSLNWPKVTLDAEGQGEIDLTKVEVSEGNLPSVSFQAPVFDSGLTLEVQYGADSGVPKTDGKDEVYLFAYQADLNQGVLGEPSLRSEGTAGVKVPAAWSGMKVHLYGFAVGGGADNHGLRSKTTYLGSGNVE